MDIRQWKNPGCAFRSAPFWSWNGEMKPELVAAQVRSMHQAGMGGFYMHSRSGLKTEYMGGEWMACIRACVEEARRLGMKANLYDEDRYSSGNHGGVIAKEDKDFVAKFLVIRKRCALEEDAMRLGAFHITFYPQPWYFYREGVVDMTPREPVAMRFPFHVTAVPDTVYLAWERNDRITVTVNGQPLPPTDGTYIDAFIDKHNIRSLLREGENVVELFFTYQPDIELEPLYMLGDFGVYLRDPARGAAVDNYTVGVLPETLRPGELKGQGLDFYTGSVYYTIPNTPAVSGVRVDDPVCTCVVLHAGEQTVVKAWGDYAFDTTAFAGVPELELELIFGRKNLFGPLHAEVKEIVEPQYFDYGDAKWQEDYILGPNAAGRITVYR